MAKKNFDNFNDPSFEDFRERFDPIMINLKQILKTVDLNVVVELFETFTSLIKHIGLSKEEILEALTFFIKD